MHHPFGKHKAGRRSLVREREKEGVKEEKKRKEPAPMAHFTTDTEACSGDNSPL